MMTSHINYTSSFATKQRSKAASIFVGMATTTNKTTNNIMKKLEIIGLNKPINIPDHIIVDETRKAVLITAKAVQAVTAESAQYEGGENRVSIATEKPFVNSDGESKSSFSKNGLSLANAIVGYDDLRYTMSECYDINNKPIFSFNKITSAQSRLFNAILNGAIITFVSVPIKAGSPTWGDKEKTYEENVCHYEILNIAIPNEAKACDRLEKSYQRYIATEERKQAQAAAAEVAQPLPEL